MKTKIWSTSCFFHASVYSVWISLCANLWIGYFFIYELESTKMPKKKSIVKKRDWDTIELKWVKTHNLKDIDIVLPKNQLITVTGVSWSWKSSLAFHTIYKEWQFRYIESLSSYLRQFFNLWTRPDLDMSIGLSPAIAIEQNKSIGSSRSTVWTITEIDDYIRLLFAKLGDMYSYESGKRIQAQTIDHMMKSIVTDYQAQKIFLLQQVIAFDEQSDFERFVKKNRNRVERGKWFTRYLLVSEEKTEIDPIEFFYLETPNVPETFYPLKVYGIYDRVTVEEKKMDRLREDVIKILAEAPKFGVYVEGDESQKKWKKSTKTTHITRFTDKNYDADNDIEYPEFSSQHFSPNRQEWACPECHGIGEVLQVDLDKVIDGTQLYLNAILPWRDSKLWQALLKKLAHKNDIAIETRRSDLPERFLFTVINGDDELLRIPMGGWKYISMYYKGIEDVLKDQYNKWLLTVDFQAMLDMDQCPECHGARLRKESLHVMIDVSHWSWKKKKNWKKSPESVADETIRNRGTTEVLRTLFRQGLYNIARVHALTIGELVDFFAAYQKQSSKADVLIDRIVTPLLDRLETINGLGLGYLNLSRGVKTLSWWEVQRLRLAKQLGNKLTGIIYVLDEPTIWLDDKEIDNTITAIQQLKEMGNTIVVVEHHDRFIAASDWVVEIGPWAGDFWWHVQFNWPYKDFIKGDTLTAEYMRGERVIDVTFDHNVQNHSLRIKKASKYNLQDVDVEIPLWSFTIITWPSGAGKTTLMYTTLYRFLNEKQKYIQSYIRLQLLKQGLSWQEIISLPVMKRERYDDMANLATQAFYKDIAVESILGYEEVKNIMYVNQSSIGKTPRSCPATFVGLFDDIRKLYAWVQDAKYLAFTTGHFSFNSSKGNCAECKWYGYKKVELQFLPDTYVECELCRGKRYKPEILDIKRRDKNISQVLDMYVDDALYFFEEMSHIHKQLQLMVDIGLWYLKLWQPAHMLSGWESQRLKLVKHLLTNYKGHTMYFLDEPTVGLHAHDVEKLLKVLKQFLDEWDTIVMIEHDQHLLKFADKVITLENGKLT